MVNVDVTPWFLYGPGADWMRRLGIEVLQIAVRLVGFDAFTHDYRRYPRHLVETIDMVQIGTEIDVGSDQDYALAHHEGTSPHPIAPRRARRLVLKYPDRRVVLPPFVSVLHPGTRPNPYLRNALWAMLVNQGMGALPTEEQVLG